MNRFDDLLPEEQEPQNKELITLLKYAYRKPVHLPPTKQEQVLERVREQLMKTEIGDSLNADILIPQIGVMDSTPLRSVSQPRARHRNGRRFRLIALLAAVLVIGAFIVTDLLIFHLGTLSTIQPSIRPDRFIISSTSLIAKDYSLNGVAALSENDIWVIGDNPIRRPPRPQALFKHWNGSQWVIYPDPASATQTVSLRAIAAASPSDIWVVGSVEGSFQSLIQHWNGSRWSVVPSPPMGNTINEYRTLVSITAIAANDAWAVGDYSPGGSVGDRALIEHWDGTRWSMLPSPHPGIESRLLKVEAVSANDVWAVGSFTDGSQGQSLILHWDGSQWSVVNSPHPGKAGNELSSLTVVSAHDIWAVGSFWNSTHGQNVEELLALHWDGSQWSVVESPGLGNSITLTDVAALSANDVWAVGNETDTNVPIIEHWDGTRWSVVKRPGPATDDALYGMDRVPHSNSIIVVGTTYYSTGETGTVLYITNPGGNARDP